MIGKKSDFINHGNLLVQGPVSQKLFRRTKFVNAMKSHSVANFVQIHVANGFVKLAPDLPDPEISVVFLF